MKHSKEFLITSLLFYSIITILNFSILKHMQVHFEMNGSQYNQVGMMEYQNPADGKKLYFLMYTKGDK